MIKVAVYSNTMSFHIFNHNRKLSLDFAEIPFFFFPFSPIWFSSRWIRAPGPVLLPLLPQSVQYHKAAH